MHKFRTYLLKKGISQRELAQRLGVSEAYMSEVVRHTRKALSLRKRMVEELGIPASVVGIPQDSPTAR